MYDQIAANVIEEIRALKAENAELRKKITWSYDPVGKRVTQEEARMMDGKNGPYLWWGNVPDGWLLYCGPAPDAAMEGKK